MTSILAVDLSLTCTGLCLDGETSRITTKLRGWDRVQHIYGEVRCLANLAELVVLEGYSYGSKGRAVFQIAELGGVIRSWLWTRRDDRPFVDVPPSTLKKYATGKGNAGKDEMIAAAIRRFDFGGCDNNEADAYLLWCMARHAYGEPVADVPKVQAEAVSKIEWPKLAARRGTDTNA